MLEFLLQPYGFSLVKLILVRCQARFFLPCVAATLRRRPSFVVSLFLSFLFAHVCVAQSSGSADPAPASRATVIYQHGLAALQKGDLVTARAAFEKVVRLAPQSPEGHNSLGWVLLAQGEIDAATIRSEEH